jgi:hypothetical protein
MDGTGVGRDLGGVLIIFFSPLCTIYILTLRDSAMRCFNIDGGDCI